MQIILITILALLGVFPRSHKKSCHHVNGPHKLRFPSHTRYVRFGR